MTFNKNNKTLAIAKISIITQMLILMNTSPVYASEDIRKMTFNPNFLQFSDGDDSKKIDLSYFSITNGAGPGVYRVDVILNGEIVDMGVDISFIQKNRKLVAELTPEQLERWGIDIKKVSLLGPSVVKTDISNIFNGAHEDFDTNNRKYTLSIPQSYLKPQDWLSTPSHLWDDGIPALMVNYQFNYIKQNNNGRNSLSQFLSLDNALNLGGWRLRQSGNWSTNSFKNEHHWQPMNVYLQHDYSFLQGGQFTIGQTSTSNNVFDSFPFEGVQFSSDDAMIAAELSQYSPVVRGISYSQALVSVKQNGIVIYQKSVPPGPFEIRDFNQFFTGDIEVEIRESDGRVRQYTQTSAILPILQREGRMRYNLTMGKYRSSSTHQDNLSPKFIQSSGIIGLPSEYTLYGGTIKADNYTSALLGVGKYSEIWGAFSFDITHARSQLTRYYGLSDTQSGNSYRFMYSRGFAETNTLLNITGYRYATRGYYGFDELQQIQESGLYAPKDINSYHQRSRISTTLSQELDMFGQINLSASRDQYWDISNGYNISASYSFPFRRFSAIMSLGYNKHPYNNAPDKSLYLSISVPLNKFFSDDNLSLTTNTMIYNGQTQQQIGFNGASKDGSFSYAASQGWKNQNNGGIGNVNLYYRGPYAQMNGAYSYQKDISQWIYGIGGGITLHRHGITLSQPLTLDSANALVQVRGAHNIKIFNGAGLYTNWFGYAVIPSLNPYNRNKISLDVNSIKSNVELLNTDVTVIPNRGALIPAKFKVHVGNKAMITLLRHDHSPVPLGSIVTLVTENEQNSSIVADQGQVYMSGLPEKGTLLARWGKSKEQQCKTSYKLDDERVKFSELILQCQ
ncbi:fimbrial biogenesis outer membrane usher protein [Escherichia coli]